MPIPEKRYPFFLNVLLFLCLFVLNPAALQGQKNIINHQYWLDFYPHYYNNKNFEFFGNSGIYMQLGKTDYIRIQIKPSVSYVILSSFKIDGGVAVKYYSEADSIHRFEFTPYEGLQIKWPAWQRLSFQHTLKVEERWSVGLNLSNNFDMRFRYKINTIYKFFKTPKIKYWFLTAHFEYFLPLHNDIKELYSNRLRTGLGLGRNFSTLWRGIFLLNLQRARSGPEEKLAVNAITYQLKIYKYFWAKPKEIRETK